MLHVIIVDDEEKMRYILKKALLKMPGIDVVGEAENGEEAVKLVETVKPDGAFMDVEMPGVNGIDAAKMIADVDPKCMIVFITAYQEYMPEAFELYAFDYIVKPFQLQRLEQTIQRMRLLKPNLSPSSSSEALPHILLKNKEGMAVIHPKDIILIQREDRSTMIITEKDRFTTTETLSELEEKLPAHLFLRSHKSYIIQIEKIKRIHPYGRWTYVVQFEGTKEDALLTKEKAKLLEERFNFTIGS